MKQIDQRLAKLNAKLCFFIMDKEVMAERIIYSRCQKWRKYISRFGKTEEEIIEYYYRKQQEKGDLVEKSSLESIIINTSSAKWDKLAGEVVDFWRV